MENIRVFLIVSLLTVVFLFFQAWEKDNSQLQLTSKEVKQELSLGENVIRDLGIDHEDYKKQNIKKETLDNLKIKEQSSNHKNIKLIDVKTELFNLKINPKGGDLVFLEMNNYLDDDKKNKYILFNDTKSKYVMQTGLISKSGPDSHKLGRAVYYSEKQLYDFKGTKNDLIVDLKYSNKNIDVIKRFIFKNNSYEISIKHIFKNNSSETLDTNIYARIRKKHIKKEEGFFPGTSTFNGVVVSNENDSF